MNSSSSRFAHSSNHDLIDAFSAACTDLHVASAAFSVFTNGESSHLVNNGSEGARDAAESGEIRVAASCMIKPFIAATAVRAFCAAKRSLDEELAAIVGVGKSGWSGITIRQLLNDTHGLDDPDTDAFPRTADGRVDVARMYERTTSVPTLHAPGELTSYSDVGSVLAAAAIETLAGRTIGEILRSQDSFLTKSSRAELEDSAVICPSTGGALQLSSADLLQLGIAMLKLDRESREAMFGEVIPTPGFAQGTRGVCLGFNAHENGWFGYNAATREGASLALRFNIDEQIAVAVVSHDMNAVRLLNVMFDGAFAQSGLPKQFQPATRDEVAALDLDRCVGTYRCGPLEAVVSRAADAASLPLVIKLSNRDSSVALLPADVERPLRFSGEYVFFTAPPLRRAFTFGQFLAPKASDKCEYLWSGRRVWRRSA